MSSTNSATVEQLAALSVPVSTDACRSCADPCDEDHGEYASRFEVDFDSQLLGTVQPLHRQVIISTGRTDWAREVTEVQGSLAQLLLETRERLAPPPFPAGGKKPEPPKSTRTHGVFAQSDSNKLSILNGSHVSIADDHDAQSVLVFPDYTVVESVKPSSDGVDKFWKQVLDPALAPEVPLANGLAHILPYSCVILLCSHKRRDNRCAVAAPKLEERFCDELERAGWEVHSRLGHPDVRDESREELLHEAAASNSALILKTSHIGGHRYAGNVQIFMPQGTCVWYARVSPHEVNAIVKHTILEGKVIPQLLRAGLNIARPSGKTLLDW
ncbi:Sucraseferredoxin-like protein [Exidia glandulosa HHB12029]|uniref:Sucraseferredoxin-like protein n=1 Tax=Exidia glandulosa HHB12029 TaxID=1314781 RepID=A0A165KP28_EXIGL|nr:Sucraseferredoxin-like protein [Exidia glandulosa HHB12029]